MAAKTAAPKTAEGKTSRTPKDPQKELPEDMRATYVEPPKQTRHLNEWNCFEDDAIELHLYLAYAQAIGNKKTKEEAEASVMRFILSRSVRKFEHFADWKGTEEGKKALAAVAKAETKILGQTPTQGA
jgi:hypothetical protein